MQINVTATAKALGARAAALTAEKINKAMAKKDTVRIVLSTGASQLDTIEALLATDIDWARVEMFHLDEYVGLPITHKASFRKYLQERFVSRIPLKAAHWVEDTLDCIPVLTEAIRRAPVDVGLIGIGENAHIAFNDPPADFEDEAAFKVVTLDEACRRQQVGEGWFASEAEVPRQAISMTVKQIMRCETIISCVPYAVKAGAIARTMAAPQPDAMIPASMLKTHDDFYLFADADSWNGFSEDAIRMPGGKTFGIIRG